MRTVSKMILKCAVLFILLNCISGQILPPTGIRIVRPGPVIITASGPIQGQEETYDIFRRINTYKGIRYAQAPVGNLRFRQGVPPVPWQQTYQAFNYGANCPQYGITTNEFQGDEDCLFLNIATPVNIRSSLPVVVAIHGGGLQFGNGEMSILGPEFIVQENVIYVGFNYRLNVLGFLNTGDQTSPGNYGLKDMIMVLQWVQTNIENFGGNPNDVSIIGISGGAAAVHALVVSQAASGLFHKAQSHSGSLFNNWAFNHQPRTSVDMLIRNLQIHVTSNQNLMDQLRQVSTERLLRAAGLLEQRVPTLFEELSFMPSLDPLDTQEIRIFTAPIANLVRNGPINQVPYMIGFNGGESLYAIPQIINDPFVLERFNMNPNLLVPTEWNLTPNSPQAFEVINAFRNVYFGGAANITTDMAWQWSNYVSDREFIFGISKQARLHRARQQVYYFRFTYTGSLSFLQRFYGLIGLPGALHADDAFYVFRLNVAVTPVLPNDHAFTVQRRMVRLWTNFFKYSNPTPTVLDPLILTTWPQMTVNEEFLDLGSTASQQVHPFRNRMDMWHAFDQRFNP